jgi:myo-inositol-1(or 4)-monophosphatase
LPAVDLSDDRRILHEAVENAGRLALGFFGGIVRQTNKADGTPVSEADLAVDAYLKSTLLAARPAYGWLSEETDDDPARLDAARVWIVDPIDGTTSFLEGTDEWTVSVALVERGRPVLAAVANPPRGELYEARDSTADPSRCRRARRSPAAGCSPTGRPSRPSAGRHRGRRWRRRAAGRWPTACARWPMGATTPRSPSAARTTGTLPRLIWWSTRRAGG